MVGIGFAAGLAEGLDKAGQNLSRAIEKSAEIQAQLKMHAEELKMKQLQINTPERIMQGLDIMDVDMSSGRPMITIRKPSEEEIKMASEGMLQSRLRKIEQDRKVIEAIRARGAALSGKPKTSDDGLTYAPPGPATQPFSFPEKPKNVFIPDVPSDDEILEAATDPITSEQKMNALFEKYKLQNEAKMKQFSAGLEVDTAAKKKKAELEVETDPVIVKRKAADKIRSELATDEIKRQFAIFEQDLKQDPELAKSNLANKISERKAIRDLGLTPTERLAAVETTQRMWDSMLPAARLQTTFGDLLARNLYFMALGELPKDKEVVTPGATGSDDSDNIADIK